MFHKFYVLAKSSANWGPINNTVQLGNLSEKWNKLKVDVPYNNDNVRTKFQTSKHETSEKNKGGTTVL